LREREEIEVWQTFAEFFTRQIHKISFNKLEILGGCKSLKK
jgi:hypothetical protein